jgi:hypothetical protein
VFYFYNFLSYSLFIFLSICVFNKTRLIRYDSYVINEISYCNNQQYCSNSQNQTFLCPLWKAYCGPLNKDNANSFLNSTEQGGLVLEDDQTRQQFEHLCQYFKIKDSVSLRPGIPGISSSTPISG